MEMEQHVRYCFLIMKSIKMKNKYRKMNLYYIKCSKFTNNTDNEIDGKI